MTKTKDSELLAAVLGAVDHSSLPDSLRDEVSDWIAEFGGCAFCGLPATLLCDYVFGYTIGGWQQCGAEQAAKAGRLDELVDGKLPYRNHSSKQLTCDAPLCGKCAKHVGNVFWHGDGGSGCDSRDLCPCHQGISEPWRMCTTAEEAERIRMLAWKAKVFNPTPSTENDPC